LREQVAELAKIGISAYTTTRGHGDFGLADADASTRNSPRWAALQQSHAPAGLVSSVQVHAARVAEHSKPWDGWIRLEGFDAHVVSAEVGAAAVTVADCVPVFIAHPSGAVALAHAGWRGTAGGVVGATIERLVDLGLDPADLHLHLGPAICGRCYEVGPEVYEQLTGWQTVRNRNVDLRALLADQAKNAGVRSISASQWCTRCDNDRFFSHRAGDAGRQISVILAGVG
jgi:YfiH family protein